MVKAINGTFGRLWCNDEDYNTVKQFEAKAKLNWDEVPLPEQLAPEYNYRRNHYRYEGGFAIY